MSDWPALASELAQWQASGRPADLWWRDDDAADATPGLLRLLQLQRASAVPVALAVVPAAMTASLVAAIKASPADVQVVQHGYAHFNHASDSDKKIELGPQRPAQFVIGEIATGKLALENALAERVVAVLVPPWNRLAPYLVPTLPELGYAGLSQFGVRKSAMPVRGLRQVNCHLDLIDWHNGRGFIGEAAALEVLVKHLRMRRAAWSLQADSAAEPTGVMSHHAVHDARVWDFLARLFDAIRRHDHGRLLSARQVFLP